MPALIQHPDCRSAAVTAVDADAERTGDVLRLRYRLIGRPEAVLVPAPAYPERADDLWRHTCFEAFVRGASDDGYCEFNFSPSTQWAAYAFTGYRAGMRNFEVSALECATDVGDGWLELSAVVRPGAAGVWRIGLSAVIEETSGAKSYWALAHPPGKPDFHHASGFVLEAP